VILHTLRIIITQLPAWQLTGGGLQAGLCKNDEPPCIWASQPSQPSQVLVVTWCHMVKTGSEFAKTIYGTVAEKQI